MPDVNSALAGGCRRAGCQKPRERKYPGMTARKFIFLVLATILGYSPALQAETARPNVIVVVVDDLRFDEFGAGGHPYLETPNIDRLAVEGAMFTSTFHAVPLCSPNRASLLTGQYPSRSIGNINGFLKVSRVRFSANNASVPAATAACAAQIWAISRLSPGTADFFSVAAPQARASGKPIPCPGIEPMASGENALEMAALRETL